MKTSHFLNVQNRVGRESAQDNVCFSSDLDTAKLGSFIVCGLLALPHNLVCFRYFGHRVPTTMKRIFSVVSTGSVSKSKNASSQVGTWLSFSENGGFTAQTRLSTRRNCCLITTSLRSTGLTGGRKPLRIGLLLRWGCREHFVSGCWHSSGRDHGRYARECWLSTLGVLHPGVPVMWYGHIRDLSPTAECCVGGRRPNVPLLHWAQQE